MIEKFMEDMTKKLRQEEVITCDEIILLIGDVMVVHNTLTTEKRKISDHLKKRILNG